MERKLGEGHTVSLILMEILSLSFLEKKKKIDHQGRRRYIRDASFYFTYLLKKKFKQKYY